MRPRQILLQGISSSGGVLAISGDAANFAALPAASGHTNEMWRVLAAQGTLFVNRKPAGVYESDGSDWSYVADFTENDQASEIQNDSAVAGNTTKDALETLNNAANNYSNILLNRMFS
jgi:hypothetical protein